MGQDLPPDFSNFDFDYELLDRLLNFSSVSPSSPSIPTAPLSTLPKAISNTHWFTDELDAPRYADDDTQSNVYSVFESTQSVTEDPLDMEWNELSRLLTAPIDLHDSASTTPLGSFDSPNEALSLNRQLQSHLRSIISRTRASSKQQEDAEKALNLLSLQIHQKLKRRRFPISTFPCEPPSLMALNALVEETTGKTRPKPRGVEALERYFTILRMQPRWTLRERQNLVRGVRSQNEKILLNIILSRNQHTPEEARQILQHAQDHDLLMNVSGLDWDVIARQFVGSRNATDCRLQWTVCDHPMINQTSMLENKSEMESLASLSKEVLSMKKLPEGFCHPWQCIAAKLETNRTAFQCFSVYQRALNESLLKGKWTPEEDARLLEAIKIFGTGNWVTVADHIGGRTGQQCLHRYEKALNPEIKRGRWSPEEDELLRKAVAEAGEKIVWSRIRQSVPGRTDVQCRERWVNVLNPALKVAPFTEKEGTKLMELVQLYGTSQWSKVASEMPGRTDNMCWRRFKMLSVIQKRQEAAKKEQERKKKQISKKVKAVVSLKKVLEANDESNTISSNDTGRRTKSAALTKISGKTTVEKPLNRRRK